MDHLFVPLQPYYSSSGTGPSDEDIKEAESILISKKKEILAAFAGLSSPIREKIIEKFEISEFLEKFRISRGSIPTDIQMFNHVYGDIVDQMNHIANTDIIPKLPYAENTSLVVTLDDLKKAHASEALVEQLLKDRE